MSARSRYWKRRRDGAEKAYRSWTVHVGYTKGDHDRSGQRRKIDLPTQARARAWVTEKAQDERVAWMTVYPPVPDRGEPARSIYRWSRRRGWRTDTPGK